MSTQGQSPPPSLHPLFWDIRVPGDLSRSSQAFGHLQPWAARRAIYLTRCLNRITRRFSQTPATPQAPQVAPPAKHTGERKFAAGNPRAARDCSVVGAGPHSTLWETRPQKAFPPKGSIPTLKPTSTQELTSFRARHTKLILQQCRNITLSIKIQVANIALQRKEIQLHPPEHRRKLPYPGALPNPGIEPGSPAL